MAYKDNPKVAIYLVYVREAHPVNNSHDAAELEKRFGQAVPIPQHKTMEDRVLAASACMKGLKLTLPILLDSMEGTVGKGYRCVPAGMAIVDLKGNLVYYTRGPSAVQPKRAQIILQQLLEEPSKSLR